MEDAGARVSELYEECVHSSGSHPSCEKFFEILLPVLRRITLRVAQQFGAWQESEDLLQEVQLKLASREPSILEGMPRGPAAVAYFSVVAANAARDYFRRRGATKRGLARTVSSEDALLAIAGAEAGLDRGLLLSQIDQSLPPDARTQAIFGLYYRQGFSAREIAALPGLDLSVKGVESTIHRAIVHVREQLRLGRNAGKSAANPS